MLTPDETIRAQVPSDGNEILEEIVVAGGFMVLRAVNYKRIVHGIEEEDQGSAATLALPGIDEGGPLTPLSDEIGECYIGFDHETGRARCYSDINSLNVKLRIIPHE